MKAASSYRRRRGRSWISAAAALAAVASVVLSGCAEEPGPGPPSPAALRFAVAVADRSYPPDRTIEPLVLPAATGGGGALSYSLSPKVPGLTFAADSRTLTGAPAKRGTYAMTYAARDALGATAQLSFTIAVANALSSTWHGSGDQVFFLNPAGEALDQMLYTLRLGDEPAEVYLIATAGDEEPDPPVKIVDITGPAARSRTSSLQAQPRPPSEPAPERAWVTEHNNDPLPLLRGSVSRLQSAHRQQAVVRGSRETLREVLADGSFNSIPATARAVVTDGLTTAAVWVADREWACAARQCVTQSMVDAVANRFLRPGPANDLYDWVTAIFGDPWGPHRYSNIIPPAAASEIHILLYDIDGDGLPTTGDSTRVVGYFHNVHNLLRADNPSLFRGSNERLMVFLDSPILTLQMNESIGTLAHEFQHLIHFYQKRILRDAGSEVWLNEMASEVAEDLIADKLQVNGPRGVAHDDPTAGEPENRLGRLPLYNLVNDIQVTAWNGTLANYSINYALGAYLARNYGGADLFGRIVRSGRAGVEAVEEALRELGHEVAFPQLLANWAAASLLSDNTQAPVPYRYNTGTWRSSRAGGTTFRLGSIDLYNYRYGDDTGQPAPDRPGPYLHDLSAFNARTQPPHSNMYTTLGRIAGSRRLRVTAPAGSRVTVVVKE